MPGSIVDFIKKVTYQYIKGIDPESLPESTRIKNAQSILNAQLNAEAIVDTEMPISILGVDLNWEEGAEPNDSILKFSFGGYEVIQNLNLPNSKIKLRMPSNISATYNDLEESISLTWDEVSSASGYKVVRDYGEVNEQLIVDGSSGYTISEGIVTLVDNVGDNLEHTYVVLTKGTDSTENSSYTEVINGKGYSLFTENVNLTGYSTTSKTTPSNAWDVTLSSVDIAGGKGANSAQHSGGAGGRGYNYNSPIWSGANTFYFECGESTSNYGARGYFGGGNTSEINGVGGGGASRIRIGSTILCGAGGGGGGGVDTAFFDFGGCGGGGIYGAGIVGTSSSGGAGGTGGGGKGGTESAGSPGVALAPVGSFSNTTTNNGNGYINATLQYKI